VRDAACPISTKGEGGGGGWPCAFAAGTRPADLARGVSPQLSWIVLGRVTAVTHSVCNSLRRPVMCVAGWLQFGNDISPLSAFGIALASFGSLLYSQVRVAAGKSGE
jgi:hypothetical protein